MVAGFHAGQQRTADRRQAAGVCERAKAAFEFRHRVFQRQRLRHVENAVSGNLFVLFPAPLDFALMRHRFEQHRGSAMQGDANGEGAVPDTSAELGKFGIFFHLYPL